MAAMLLAKHAKVLAVGAHPDDIELGCGGALLVLRAQGAEIHLATFSKCSDESPADPDLRSREQTASARVLGAERPLVFDHPNRRLPEHLFEIMEELGQLQANLEPDLVFIPFLEDPHQDHETVARAAVRAFRRRETIVQYEILRYGSHTFTPSLFIDIGRTLDGKVDALRCYKSQLERRAYFDEQSFRSLARTRGAQSGYDNAEGFVVYKMYW